MKYWKEKAEGLEKENYKMKVRLSMKKGGASSEDDAVEAGAKPASVEKKD